MTRLIRAGDGSTLLFSIATNGYKWLYRDCIESHRSYAAANGYKYVLVAPTLALASPRESAWLKIPLMVSALNRHDFVCFLDADCLVGRNTPPLESLLQPRKSIYMTTGFSGRLNSGFMYVRSELETKQLFSMILSRADDPVPAVDATPFENGHLIHYLRDHDRLEIVGREWNYNGGEPLTRGHGPFIRHYTGPLKADHPASHGGRLLNAFYRRLSLARRYTYRALTGRPPPLRRRVEKLSARFARRLH